MLRFAILVQPVMHAMFCGHVQMGTEELRQRMRLMDNEIRIMRSDTDRIRHESTTQVGARNMRCARLVLYFRVFVVLII